MKKYACVNECSCEWVLRPSGSSDLLDAHLPEAYESKNPKVAVEEARLLREGVSKHNIRERCEPIPKVTNGINVVKVLSNMRGVEPKFLLRYSRLDCTVLQDNELR